MQNGYNQIIDHLVKNKIALPDQLQEIQMSAMQRKVNFPRQLVSEGIIDSHKLLEITRQVSNTPSFNLREISLLGSVVKRAKEKDIRKYSMLPFFERGGRLFVAVSDPFDIIGLDTFKYSGNYSSAEPVLASAEQIEQIIDEIFAGSGDMDDLFADEENEEDEDAKAAELEALSKALLGITEDNEAPVVKYVNGMLLDAIRIGASDLHFEPYEHTYRVRFRKDGVLKEVSTPPSNITNRITARIKVISSMNIAEKRKPQDGRIKLKVSDTKVIDFRVNTLPTLWGEKIVLRILDSSAAQLNIDMLGFSEVQKKTYLDSIKKPQGLVLVTGPTGSGKTVSLYSGLNILNTPSVNISTAEDPVEITLPGVNQVNVIPKQGMTFATALRAFLRQDPDIIMIGEIRDLETAEIAVKAAQTGHMVLSTLHTNDVAQTIIRLGNMGVPSYNIAGSVELIMAQRLVRRLCKSCRTRSRKWTEEQLIAIGFSEEDAEISKIYEAKGCERCGNQGYKGRAGLYQVIPISSKVSSMIMNGESSIELSQQFQKEGYWDLRQSGIDKVKSGITSIEEVIRVTID